LVVAALIAFITPNLKIYFSDIVSLRSEFRVVMSFMISA